MIKKLYENIASGQEVRQNLIELRKQLKEDSSHKLSGPEAEILKTCLLDEDAKVRKNAALILGENGDDTVVQVLYEAYAREDKLFVRSSYLKALDGFCLSEVVDALKDRLDELVNGEFEESDQKHIREEKRELQKLITATEGRVAHTFTGYDNKFDILLTTYNPYQLITADQIHRGNKKVLNAGVRVVTEDIRSISKIRTYREMLFLMSGSKKLVGGAEEIGKAIADSDLLGTLEKSHREKAPFFFRIDLRSKMDLSERSTFTRELAAVIEDRIGRKLINSVSDYEVEIRLIENSDGTFFPCYKLYTMSDNRFAYRKEFISTSINPALAATMMRLAEGYMADDAQVLDPFCGVGTMLIERDRLKKARVMYGIDSFGEAIDKAKINTAKAGLSVNYIHRDYFDFKHEYLFDEILADMPVRGKRSKDELDEIYQKFFERSKELLKEDGIIIMYSNESGFIKKQLRLNRELRLLQEYLIRKKDGYSLFIIEKRG